MKPICWSFAVQVLVPVPKYSGIANTYEELFDTWEDTRPIPPKADLQAAWDAHVIEEQAEVDAEEKITTKMRENAITDLIASGDLPSDFKDKKVK